VALLVQVKEELKLLHKSTSSGSGFNNNNDKTLPSSVTLVERPVRSLA